MIWIVLIINWISWLPNIGSAKDKHGVRESFAKVTFLFANGRSRIRNFDQQPYGNRHCGSGHWLPAGWSTSWNVQWLRKRGGATLIHGCNHQASRCKWQMLNGFEKNALEIRGIFPYLFQGFSGSLCPSLSIGDWTVTLTACIDVYPCLTVLQSLTKFSTSFSQLLDSSPGTIWEEECQEGSSPPIPQPCEEKRRHDWLARRAGLAQVGRISRAVLHGPI